MRIFAQILIIIFVIASLYALKDDIKIVYKRAVIYMQHRNGADLKQILETNDAVDKSESQILGTKKIIETPGALRVLDKFLGPNSDAVHLTKELVIEWTNKNRNELAGLPPLKENPKLDTTAQVKLQDMFNKQYFEHISPSGVGVSDLGDQAGYEYIIIGENLALGNFKDEKSLLDAWIASPGHRANILNKHYTEIGIAVGKGMFDGEMTWLAVQHFALQRDACPKIDGVLKGEVELQQKNLTSMQNDLAQKLKDIDSGATVNGHTHNEQVTIYNTLVATYNALIKETKNKITAYNSAVREFNKCLELSQAH